MRKQLARVGAVVVAAMMVGTTAFAETIPDLAVVYTGLNTVKVSVPVANSEDQATILSVKNGTALVSINGGNANDQIVYIDQDDTKVTGQAQLYADGQPGAVDFTFSTERFAEDTAGKIDIFAAGSTYEVGSALSIYKNAPVKSIALVKNEGVDAITLTGTDAATIKAGLAGKAKIVLTHETTATEAVTTEVAVAENTSNDFVFAVDAGKVGVTYTPSGNAKYGVANAAGGAAQTSISTAADAGIPVTINEPTVVSSAALDVTPKSVTFPMGTPADQITEAALKEKLTAVKVKFTTSSGAAPTDVTLDKADYSVAIVADGSAYTATVSTAKKYNTAGAEAADGTIAPTNATVPVTISTTATVSITGTVQSRILSEDGETMTAYAADTGAVVTAYEPGENDGDPLTFVSAAIVNNGSFSVDGLETGKNYVVVVSKISAKFEWGSWVTPAYTRVITENVAAGSDMGTLQISETFGDANGDGITDISDQTDTATFWQKDWTN